MILTLRSDKPEAELGLFDGQKKLRYSTFQAHRELSKMIHQQINQLLLAEGGGINNITAIVVFRGPGSFTGLRIGLSVANALAYGLGIPILGATGNDWIETGIAKLLANKNERIALPRYGAPVHITKQRK